MFTIVAFCEEIDEGGVRQPITAVIDQHVKTVGDDLFVPGINNLIGAHAFIGTTGVDASLVSPSIRRVNRHFIHPANLALQPPAVINALIRNNSPIPLVMNESLNAEIDADPAAAEYQSIIVLLADGVQAKVDGKIYTINAIADVVLTAGEWGFGELVFPEDLPIGNYDIVGASMIVANGVAFRFVPTGGVNRPGGLVCTAEGQNVPAKQRAGGMGVWCNFETTSPPGVEVLGIVDTVKTTYDLYVDLIPK